MDQNRLLLLGLLNAQGQHGYQIMEHLEKNLSLVTNIKKATLYYDLKRLEQEQLISMRLEQEAGRPPRRVYSLTPAGKRAFLEALAENLAQADPSTCSTDVGLMFMDCLPKDELRRRLAQKVEGLRERLAAYQATPSHGKDSAVDLAVSYISARLKTEISWFEALLERLASKSEPEVINP